MAKNIPEYLVIHHTGGTDLNPLADTSHHTFQMVDEWHRANPNVNLGYPSTLGYYIGYHWFIDKVGKATQGRADIDEGAHCRGYNTKSIGICLAGNFDATMPTRVQETALKVLLEKYMAQYGLTKDKIVPHRKFASKTCYGMKLADNWAQNLVAQQPPNPTKEEIKLQIIKLLGQL